MGFSVRAPKADAARMRFYMDVRDDGDPAKPTATGRAPGCRPHLATQRKEK